MELISFVERHEISLLSAKSVLTEMIDTKKSAAKVISEKNLIQISDTGSLNNIMEEVIKENAKSVTDYKQGKGNALMFLVGQAMKKSEGRANPKIVQEMLKRRLADA